MNTKNPEEIALLWTAAYGVAFHALLVGQIVAADGSDPGAGQMELTDKLAKRAADCAVKTIIAKSDEFDQQRKAARNG